jgi:hypothetical protein
MDINNLTWFCHICGQERPDNKISVMHHPLIANGQLIGMQNVRYCNDRPSCIVKAADFVFVRNEDES